MNLSSPITITPPPIIKTDGTVKNFDPMTFNELDVTIIDNSKRKMVMAQIRPCPRPIILWKDDEYTAVGDYTQAAAEAKIIELLGDDPISVLENLFVFPSRNE